MKKQTKVLLAAAALTLGASFTAMAAETYDWKMENGQWVCYDEDGDVYDNEWVESAGKDYYVGDDGVLVTNEWVDGYYLRNSGEKTINDWRYILPDGVDEDDDDAEAKYFYFGSKGRVTTGKKVIEGKTYYFDSEGQMLTGWVDYTTVIVDGEEKLVASEATGYTADVVYVNEDGSRAANMWLKSVEPGVDEEEVDEPDYFWYYIGSNGKPVKGRQLDINGETYFFRANGQMLSGWVADLGNNVYTNADADLQDYTTVYFCGGKEEGWAKKSTWINEYRNTETDDADDYDMYWFWLDSKGKLLKASTTDSEGVATAPNAAEKTFTAVVDGVVDIDTVSGNTTTHATTKEINGKDYIFNQNGEMLSGLVWFKGNTFYYGDAEDGSMKVGEVALEETTDEESYNFYFAKTKKDDYKAEGAAVTGAAAGKLYIDGKLFTRDSGNEYVEKYVDALDVWFVVDKNGNIKTSQKEYKKMNDVTEKKETYLDTREISFSKKDGAFKGSYTK